jgi:hypothetical protein
VFTIKLYHSNKNKKHKLCYSIFNQIAFCSKLNEGLAVNGDAGLNCGLAVNGRSGGTVALTFGPSLSKT